MRKKIMLSAMVVFTVLFFAGLAVAVETNTGNSTDENVESPIKGRKDNVNGMINMLKEEKARGRDAKIEQRRAEILSKVKEMATEAVNKVIAKYERLKERVKNMKVISEDRKEQIYTKIDEQIAKLNAQKEKISSTTTVEEVRQIMISVRKELKNTKEAVMAVVREIHSTHLSNIVDKLQNILERLDTKISDLKSQGKDVSNLESLSQEAKTLLESAEQKARDYDFKGAKKDILDARHKMIEITQGINELKEKDEESGEEGEED